MADCEAQVEKGLAKYRWSVRTSEAQQDGGDEERTSYRTSANEFDFRYMKATDLPFNQRIAIEACDGMNVQNLVCFLSLITAYRNYIVIILINF